MVSIVIVSFRSSEVLNQCLENLLEQLGPTDEIVIIENSGDTLILEWPYLSDIRVTAKVNKGNVGYTAACNQGVTLARNNWILLLNPDVIPHENALIEIRSVLKRKKEEEVMCVELTNQDGSRQNYYRRFPTVRALLVMFFIPSHKQDSFASYRRYTYSKDFDCRNSFEQPPGAGLLISKRNTLDEDFFVYGSDLFFCWQIVQRSGREVELIPAKFFHLRGQGGTASSPELADALRIESALGFSTFFFKSKQYLRFLTWNLFFTFLEFGGITLELLSGNSPRSKFRRFVAFILRKPWLKSAT
jgi:GT2 family glycosyltransferase